MNKFIRYLARGSAILGGLVLTGLALVMTVSIAGGAVAKFGNSEWLMSRAEGLAQFIQNTGIRTIPGMYEIIGIGMAFVIFSFLPITTYGRAHAVVDVFTSHFPPKISQFLEAFWEVIFFIVFLLITYWLFFGMDRMMSSRTVTSDLKIPLWWGYAVAFCQMIITCLVSAYIAWGEVLKLVTGRDILPKSDGAVH